MTRLPFLALTALVVLSGCSGAAKLDAHVTAAQNAYAEAAPTAGRDAPVALEEAREAVERAELARLQKQDPEVVAHLAYVAHQRVRIARATARANASTREVEALRAERQQVQLEARTAEAEAAQRRAEAAQGQAEAAQRAAAAERAEAEAARARADAALRRAQQLAAQVDDLQAQLTNRGLVLTLGDVLFDTAQSTLKPGGMRAVDKLVTFMTENPRRTVLVEGFTDSVGSDASNQTLSERRAASVRDALVARGIAPARVRTRGFGEGFPVASNETASGRQENRRVEVVISDESGVVPERTAN